MDDGWTPLQPLIADDLPMVSINRRLPPTPQAAHQVQRQAVVGEHDDEEDEVHEQVQHVGHQLRVKHPRALRFRGSSGRRGGRGLL